MTNSPGNTFQAQSTAGASALRVRVPVRGRRLEGAGEVM